nr:MAG TPA: hypothetical protein [Caudoviricetes sp.]
MYSIKDSRYTFLDYQGLARYCHANSKCKPLYCLLDGEIILYT